MNPRVVKKRLVAGLTLVTLSPTTQAQTGPIMYVSQDRYVKAKGYGPQGRVEESASATDFGPFVKSIEVGTYGIGKADQISVLDASTINLSGSGKGTHYLNAMNGVGISSATIKFEIDTLALTCPQFLYQLL